MTPVHGSGGYFDLDKCYAEFKEKNMGQDCEQLRYIGWREKGLTEGWITTLKDRTVHRFRVPPKPVAPRLHIDGVIPDLAIETLVYTKRTIWYGTKEVAKFWAPEFFSDERAIAGFFNSLLANQ